MPGLTKFLRYQDFVLLFAITTETLYSPERKHRHPNYISTIEIGLL